MLSGASPSCFPNDHSQAYVGGDDHDHVLVTNDAISSSHDSTSLLYSLSLLKNKVHQLHSLLTTFLFPHHQTQSGESPIAIATTATLIQEIIVTASSMMFTCQQMALISPANPDESRVKQLPSDHVGEERDQVLGLYSTDDQDQTLDWYGANNYNPFDTNDNNNYNNKSDDQNVVVTQSNQMGRRELLEKSQNNEGLGGVSPMNYDIIELGAADLLAKYTHYCQVCGKGFKRDANLRMHMRAHGDEYKSNAALVNPMKNVINGSSIQGNKEKKQMRKYSCPHEGCRWNRKHEKFQPLKSMICVKNHYKRSHCPKMYVCKRCIRKQFSVLSDLRTHEKHCGDLRWQCSCGTTFSRKDKLMGHVALFFGHSPVINSPVVKDQKSSAGILKDVMNN